MKYFWSIFRIMKYNVLFIIRMNDWWVFVTSFLFKFIRIIY